MIIVKQHLVGIIRRNMTWHLNGPDRGSAVRRRAGVCPRLPSVERHNTQKAEHPAELPTGEKTQRDAARAHEHPEDACAFVRWWVLLGEKMLTLVKGAITLSALQALHGAHGARLGSARSALEASSFAILLLWAPMSRRYHFRSRNWP